MTEREPLGWPVRIAIVLAILWGLLSGFGLL